MPEKIPFLRKGDRRTMLSARLANQVLSIINAMVGIRPGKGLKITWSDAGLVIELSDDLQKGLGITDTPPDGQSSGPLRWMGEWDSSVSYSKNDIVIHRSVSAINNGTKAGTYIAVDDNLNEEPFEDDSVSQTIWRTFAKGAWDSLVISTDAVRSATLVPSALTLFDPSRFGETDISVGLDLDGVRRYPVSGVSWQLGQTALTGNPIGLNFDGVCDLASGLTSDHPLAVRSVTYAIDGLGTTERRLFLCSEPY